MRQLYILMADVIGSSDKNSVKLISDFKWVINRVNKENEKCLLSPLTITLGDEFQGIVKDIDSCVQLIIAIEEEIIRRSADFKLRYVVQYGEVATRVNSKTAYGMLGSGLTMARENLIEFKSNKRGRVLIKTGKAADDILLENLFYVYASIKDSWKPTDYYLIYEFLKGSAYSLVGKKLLKTPSLMWKRERTLGIKQYFAIKDAIIDIVKRIV